MKLLHRIQPGPNVLSNYDFNTQGWDDMSSSDKREIWDGLVKMQGKMCAYCERKINMKLNGDKHIEHFKRKGIYRELTFNWDNLFGSCGERTRCGFYKDKQNYNESDLIKADERDPEHFFLFTFDGGVNVRDGLDARDKVMAETTLKVFNLNPSRGGVKAERKNAIQKSMNVIMGYVKMCEELMSPDDDEDAIDQVREYIRDDYYKSISNFDFLTARKHVFESLLP